MWKCSFQKLILGDFYSISVCVCGGGGVRSKSRRISFYQGSIGRGNERVHIIAKCSKEYYSETFQRVILAKDEDYDVRFMR